MGYEDWTGLYMRVIFEIGSITNGQILMKSLISQVESYSQRSLFEQSISSIVLSTQKQTQRNKMQGKWDKNARQLFQTENF